MTTKQQERKALEKIRKIVADLGRDSYIGTAMQGVFEIAETNIEWDAAFSLAEELEGYKKREAASAKVMENAKDLEKEIARLEAELEKEREWKPYECDRNVKQEDYQALATAASTRILSDEEATALIVDEFGFSSAKITILHSVCKEEINRHGYCRRTGQIERSPVYNATDWNYIRFDCAGWHYEMHNGSLNPYYC